MCNESWKYPHNDDFLRRKEPKVSTVILTLMARNDARGALWNGICHSSRGSHVRDPNSLTCEGPSPRDNHVRDPNSLM